MFISACVRRGLPGQSWGINEPDLLAGGIQGDFLGKTGSRRSEGGRGKGVDGKNSFSEEGIDE